MQNYACYFKALEADSWSSGRLGGKWWAKARIDGQSVEVQGFLTEILAIEALLTEISACVC